MSKLFIEDTTLTAIGDAIRAKSGASEKLAPQDMPQAIANLPSGGGGGGEKNYTVGYEVIKSEPYTLEVDITQFITNSPEEDIICMSWTGGKNSNGKDYPVVYLPEYKNEVIFLPGSSDKDGRWLFRQDPQTKAWTLNASSQFGLYSQIHVFYKIYN